MYYFILKNMAEKFRPIPREIAGRRAQRPESRFRQPRIVESDEEDDLEALVRDACLGTKIGVDVGRVLLKISEFLDDEALVLLHQCVKQRVLSDLRKFVENVGERRSTYTAVCRTINEELLNDQAVIDWVKVELQLGIGTLPKKP